MGPEDDFRLPEAPFEAAPVFTPPSLLQPAGGRGVSREDLLTFLDGPSSEDMSKPHELNKGNGTDRTSGISA